jgi:putative glycosyltransferase (TIGR04372 family)
MSFTEDENQRAEDWLASIGWQPGDRFVCLLVRDSAYLATEPGLRPADKGGKKGSGPDRWSYHDFRDSDVGTYDPAAARLAAQAVWVLRMRKTMAKPMPSSHPRIVDYAFRVDRSDFLDVWLFANCNLCISTGTGPDMIADAFRRPLLAVNFLPAIGLWSWSNAVTAPKPLVWRDSGRRLSVEELIAADWLHSEQYEEHGVEIRDLDAATLLGIVQEAWGRLTGGWVDAVDDARRNQTAWAALEAHPEYANWHGYRHPEARFSSVWLRQLDDELTGHDRPKSA